MRALAVSWFEGYVGPFWHKTDRRKEQYVNRLTLAALAVLLASCSPGGGNITAPFSANHHKIQRAGFATYAYVIIDPPIQAGSNSSGSLYQYVYNAAAAGSYELNATKSFPGGQYPSAIAVDQKSGEIAVAFGLQNNWSIPVWPPGCGGPNGPQGCGSKVGQVCVFKAATLDTDYCTTNTWGTGGSGSINQPFDVAYDSNDNLYVGSQNGVYEYYYGDTTPDQTWTPNFFHGQDKNWSQSVGIDANNDLYTEVDYTANAFCTAPTACVKLPKTYAFYNAPIITRPDGTLLVGADPTISAPGSGLWEEPKPGITFATIYPCQGMPSGYQLTYTTADSAGNVYAPCSYAENGTRYQQMPPPGAVYVDSNYDISSFSQITITGIPNPVGAAGGPSGQ